MDPFSHLLAGASIARTGLNRTTALATLCVTLAAEAPDLDFLARVRGPVFGFTHDRGFTHSFVGVAFVSAAVVGLVYVFWRLIGRKTRDPKLVPRWGLLLAFAYLGGLSHILLDFGDNYGVRPYWPFSGRWYSWDIVFITDPVVIVLLLGGLLAPALSNLMNEELGLRRKARPGRLGATLALLGVFAIWGIRDHEHRRALRALQAHQYDGAVPVRTSAYPFWWNPCLWRGVVETPRFVATMQVDSLGLNVDPEGEIKVRFKPEETPVTLAAKNSPFGRFYMNWARYPLAEIEPLELGERGYVVRLEDSRFERTGRVHYFPLATIRLNHDLSVADETFENKGY